MQLQNFITNKQKMLNQAYKGAKLISYTNANMIGGEIHEMFILNNTPLSSEGQEIFPKNFKDHEGGVSLVKFQCKLGKEEIIKEFVFALKP